MEKSVDALLEHAVRRGEVPGVVAALTTSQQTIYAGAYGETVLGQGTPMTQDTVMWIASMTKPVVAVAAMQLVERGLMSLDTPAADLLPELGLTQVLDGWDRAGQPVLRPARSAITLRHLLTHTAGFTYDMWNVDMARFHRVTNTPRAGTGKLAGLKVPLSFDPGEQWEYGINIDWVGRLVEAASGLRLSQYLTRHITGPLGMSSTAFRLTPAMRARMARVHQRDPGGLTLNVTDREVTQDPEFEPGGGGLYSTANDYLRFLRMILNRGACNDCQLLQPETIALMSRNAMGPLRVKCLPTQNRALSLDADFFPGEPKTWGLSFMINETVAPTGRSAGSLGWAGLGNTYFWIDPRRDIAGIILMQILPFMDTRAMTLFTTFENAVYAARGQGK